MAHPEQTEKSALGKDGGAAAHTPGPMGGPVLSAPTWSPETDDGSDPRFTLGLALDVAKALAQHGYPDLTNPADGLGVVDLELALFHFIRKQAAAPGEVACAPCIGCGRSTSAIVDGQPICIRSDCDAMRKANAAAQAEGRS